MARLSDTLPVRPRRLRGAVNEDVGFEAIAEAAAGGGCIISVEWDFDGSGLFAEKHIQARPEETTVRVQTTHRFDEPGTYFPAVRVVSRRPGREDWSGVPEAARTALLPTGLENLDRVRIVVT